MSSSLTNGRQGLAGLAPAKTHSPGPAAPAGHAAGPPQAPAAPTARPGRRVSTGAVRPTAASQPSATDLRCWATFKRRAQDLYDGEYGFDWIEWKHEANSRNHEMTKVMDIDIARLNYCYDAQQKQYLPVDKDVHLRDKLQSQYQRLSVYGKDYYAAWLSVRPGQEVKLYLNIEALNEAPPKGDYLTFGKHASYQVTVNGQLNEAIRIPLRGGKRPQLEDVAIKCLHPCTETSLQVFDEKGHVVGQLNVASNQRTYHLPIRVVYLVKDGPASTTNLRNLQATFASLYLKEFLNEHSLNQAQIQVEFEKTNHIHQLVFKEADWAGKFYDVTNKWFTNYLLFDPIEKSVKIEYFLDEVLNEYLKKYESNGATPFRGILLVMTDIPLNPAENIGGESKIRPTNFRGALIYEANKHKDRSLYAHEIAHALGLDHSFFQVGRNTELTELALKKAINKKRIALLKAQQDTHTKSIAAIQLRLAQNKALLAGNTMFYFLNPTERKRLEQQIHQDTVALKAAHESLSKTTRDLAFIEQEVSEHVLAAQTFPANPFKFAQRSTTNFMDYHNEPNSFFQWQWRVLQRDVAAYYGS